MSNIIAISGKLQSGKNLFAKIWQLLDIWYNQYDDADRKEMGNDNYHEFVLKYYNKKYFSDNKYTQHESPTIEEESDWETKAFATKIKQIGVLLFGCRIEDFENNDFKNSQIPEQWRVWRFKYQNKYYIFNTYEEAKNCFDNISWIEKGFENSVVEEWLPTYREFLQYVGTELFRNQFNPNTWALATFSDMNKDSKYLVTDTRFLNEVDVVKQYEGEVTRINRYKVGDKVSVYSDILDGFVSGFYINQLYDDCCEVVKIDDDDEVYYTTEYNEIKKDPVEGEHASETELDDYSGFDYVVENHADDDIGYLVEQVRDIMITENVIKF